MRLVSALILTLALAGCGSASKVRAPSAQERREIVAVTRWDYAYESEIGGPIFRPLHLRPRHLHPKVVGILVSRSDPRFAVEVVELRDSSGRRRFGTEVRLLQRIRGNKPAKRLVSSNPPWELVEESGTGFPLACTGATPTAVRDLSCPDPWSVLWYPRPRERLSATVHMRIASPNLHTVDWRNVAVPGIVCGAAHPIRLHGPYSVGFVRRSALFPWWPAVEVGAGWNAVHYGDLDGDGRDEAVLDLDCANGGGTAGGQLAFASVIFAARGRSLRSIGIVTPRQRLDPSRSHVPLLWSEIRPGKVIAHEGWYGRRDGTCCSSGRATSIWRYSNGRLRLSRTIVNRRPGR